MEAVSLPSDEELYDLANKIVRTYRYDDNLEDYTQEVALALWRAVRKFEPDRASLRTYLWQVGKWALKDYDRKDHRYYKLSRHTATRHYIDQVEFDEAWQGESLDVTGGYGREVVEAFNDETPRNKRILFEHLVEDRTARDIGKEYGISESRICQIVSRFRERFSARENYKSLPQPQTVTRCLKQHTRYLSPRRQSRVIVDTSFLSSVQETLLTQ